jgi:hypothetical protein
MKSIITLIIAFIFLSCLPNKTAVEIIEVEEEIEEAVEETISTKQGEIIFPENWYGKWKGTLMIYNNNGKTQEIAMEIHIEPTDSVNRCKMTLIYGEGDKANERPYELVTIDAENGYYQTDEKNTIYLDDYYFNGVLYSRFEVMGNLLLTRIEKRNGKLYFEIISGRLDSISTTGNDEANDIPPVNSYKINVSQRAELIRYW